MVGKENVFYYGNTVKYSISNNIKEYIIDNGGNEAFQILKEVIDEAFNELSKITNIKVQYIPHQSINKRYFEITVMDHNLENARIAQINRHFVEKIDVKEKDFLPYGIPKKKYFNDIIKHREYDKILTQEEINSLYLFKRLPYSNVYNKNFFKINKYILGGEIEIGGSLIQNFLSAFRSLDKKNYKSLKEYKEERQFIKKVILHELGHGLGLEHTHENINNVENETVEFTRTTDYSVMSYLAVPELENDTFMMGDVEKIHYFLKPNLQYSKDNTIYEMKTHLQAHIYDTGGNDTLISKQNEDIHIDIRKGYYSGHYKHTPSGKSKIYYNISIHPTAEIENAIALNTGQSATIIGNYLNNLFIGGNIKNYIFANGDEIKEQSIIHKQKKEYQRLKPTITYQDNDHIITGNKEDFIIAGFGDDFVQSGPGNDDIRLGDGSDRCIAGPGDDKIRSYKKNQSKQYQMSFLDENGDIIFSESGEDEIYARGDDFVNSGSGNDKIEYTFYQEKTGNVITGRGDDVIKITGGKNPHAGTLIIHDFNREKVNNTRDKIIFDGEKSEILSFVELLKYATQGYMDEIQNEINLREIPKKSAIYRELFKKIEKVLTKEIISDLVGQNIIDVPRNKQHEFERNKQNHPEISNNIVETINTNSNPENIATSSNSENHIPNMPPTVRISNTPNQQIRAIQEMEAKADVPRNQIIENTYGDSNPHAFIAGLPPTDIILTVTNIPVLWPSNTIESQAQNNNEAQQNPNITQTEEIHTQTTIVQRPTQTVISVQQEESQEQADPVQNPTQENETPHPPVSDSEPETESQPNDITASTSEPEMDNQPTDIGIRNENSTSIEEDIVNQNVMESHIMESSEAENSNREKYTLIDTTYYSEGQNRGYKIFLLNVGIEDLSPDNFAFYKEDIPLADIDFT